MNRRGRPKDSGNRAGRSFQETATGFTRGSAPRPASGIFLVLLLLSGAPEGAALSRVYREGPWREYSVYQPRVERYDVVNTHRQALRYNHCSDIAWFRDRWFVVWNGNTEIEEGRDGTKIYMSTSRDGVVWTEPVAAFSDERASENPIPVTGIQWQPGLLVVGDELWAMWHQLESYARQSPDLDRLGCYHSILRDPDGKWTNRKLEWDGRAYPVIRDLPWRVFPSLKPVRLDSGRVLAPVNLIGPDLGGVSPPGVTIFRVRGGRFTMDSVLYTDDLGATWGISEGTTMPAAPWAQWEPTIWQEPDGTVMMFARNHDERPPESGGPLVSQRVAWSLSRDEGVTWTPKRIVPLETANSRMHVVRGAGNRYIMAANDWTPQPGFGNRYNLALFFNRGGGIAFTAGVNFSGDDRIVAYPQMEIRGNRALISYTEGMPRGSSIRVAHVEPMPDPDIHYLFPRSNVPAPPNPVLEESFFRFSASDWIQPRRPLRPSPRGMTVAAWLRPDRGAILDTRLEPGDPGGFILTIGGALHETRPLLFWGPHRFAGPRDLDKDAWSFVAFTVDPESGRAVLHDPGGTTEFAFDPGTQTAAEPRSVTIGFKNFEASATAPYTGDLRFLALYDRPLDPDRIRWIRNQAIPEPATTPSAGAATPDTRPALWFDPADAAAFRRDFRLPDTLGERVESAEADGTPVLRFHGQTSAGVDLDPHRRHLGDEVQIEFSFRVEHGDRMVICTMGDALEPVRLRVEDGTIWLESEHGRHACGPLVRGAWTPVRLRSGGTWTAAEIGTFEARSVRHHPVAAWVYLGQGYREAGGAADSRFSVDVSSVRTRVLTPRFEMAPMTP